MAEERVACPRRLEWLRAMNEILPPEVFERSKLGKFKKCLEDKSNE